MKHHLAEREIASQKYYIDWTAGDHERLFLALRTQRSELPMLPRSIWPFHIVYMEHTEEALGFTSTCAIMLTTAEVPSS